MQEGQDISTTWAGVLAFGTFIGGIIGGIIAVAKGGKSKTDIPNKEDRDMLYMERRIEEIEKRQSQSDIRIEVAMSLFEEVKEQSADIKKQLSEMNTNITKALTQLEERRRK